ncbi:indolethylamine N-methyltransferase-like [Dendropsophus ebraccatus]|uniref:indolethylamine N-methyltransferase-like n=1 Tax=Dendropsophus ebraccatus TaxID=150705 RepID=UPI003831BF21
MDSCTHKRYDKHGFDSRKFSEHYFSNEDEKVYEDDTLKFPIECLTQTFEKGYIKGDTLIDMSVGSLVHHLYVPCEFFKTIIVLKARDRCILELKRWVNTRTGAFDWGHITELHSQIGGISDQNKEEKVRSAINHVMKFNLCKENIVDPIVLPQADCIITAWLLDAICKDHNDFIKNLKKITAMLKPGGYLLFFGCKNMTYYTVGKDKLHAFPYDEEMTKNALVADGFVIDDCRVHERTAVDDLCNFKAITFILAHKEK